MENLELQALLGGFVITWHKAVLVSQLGSKQVNWEDEDSDTCPQAVGLSERFGA